MILQKKGIRFFVLSCTLCMLCGLSAQAQMTRGELLRKFYQITSLHNSGRDVDAIAVCEEIVSVYPSYPDTYRRMAEIYDEAGDGELAVMMYRKYISLEMDDAKVAESRSRLKELESKLGVPHYDDEEQAAFERAVKPFSSVSRPSSSVSVPATEWPDDAVQSLPSEDLSFGSLFDILSLVSSAESDDESEWLEESLAEIPVDRRDNPISMEQMGSVAEGLVPDGYDFVTQVPDSVINTVDAIFARMDKDRNVSEACTEPFRFVAHKGLLDGFVAKLDGGGSPLVRKEKFTSASSVSGKWISSLYNEDTGLEFLIVDIRDIGNGLSLSFDTDCGLFREHKNNLLKTSWNRIKSIWSTDGARYDVRELEESMSSVEYSDDYLFVSCPLSKKDRPDLGAMGKNLMDNLSVMVPFGNVVSRLGGSLLNYIIKKQGNASFQTVIEMTFKSVTDDVLSCEFIVRETQVASGTTKTVMIDDRTFYMFRAPATYEAFNYVNTDGKSPIYRELYGRLQTRSAENPSLLFPLAMMSYCKIGMGGGVSDVSAFSKALTQMQRLSDEGCVRASAWLIPVYYNLSMDVQHYPLRSQRKHFRELSVALLDNMLQKGYSFAYGLQGDIISGGTDGLDEAVESYKSGMRSGDPHSCYRMGLALMDGQSVQRDMYEAVSCFRKAADMGYADAYLQLALAYKNGSGVERDYKRYISYLIEAVETGSVDALSELSDAFMWGAGVGRDVNDAIAIRRLYFKKKDNAWLDALEAYGCLVDE